MKRVMSVSAAAVVAGFALSAAGELSPIVPFVLPSGKPTAEDARGIVRDLKAHGFDQFLVYPSTGLEHEYLGDDFFAMMGAFLDEAERLGMKEWLYDEFNWPSGTAQGRVPAENADWLYRELVAVKEPSGAIRWETVVSRELNVDNYCLDGNNYEPAGVRRFMELTHHAYARRFGRHLGTTVPGIFSDEPGHCSGAWRLKTPQGTALRLPCWSGMEDEYRAASGGRDFRADCEAALRDGSFARSDVPRLWADIRSRRYRRSYFDPIAAWCGSVGIESCGHLLGEDGPGGCIRVNGTPLNTLVGFTKPGIDLITSDTGRHFEWLTLALAQSAARRRGKPGIVELLALGPCDMTFATMRKMYWICALHGIDTFFQALYHQQARRFNVKDSWAMFTSPTQPWYREMPLLHGAAKEAARWARKPVRCDLALVYPAGACAAAAFGAKAPDLPELCRALTWSQFTYDLLLEGEPSAKAVVLDWRDGRVFDRVSGRQFADFPAVVAYLEGKFPDRPRVKGADGRTLGGYLTREYADGSAVAVDVTKGEVLFAEGGRFTPPAACPAGRPVAERWAYALSGPTARRVWFGEGNRARIVADQPLKGVRFAVRRYPADVRFAVKIDGEELTFDRPCADVAFAFNEICRETAPRELAAGEHALELSGGADGKLFLPVLWMVGDFAEPAYGHCGPLPKDLGLGSLAAQGLPSFAGVVTYRTQVAFAPGERLTLDTGGTVARVRFGGCDLGARGWAPFVWEIPADLTGAARTLEIDLATSARPIFGDEKAPDARLNHKLWIPSTTATPSPAGLLRAMR